MKNLYLLLFLSMIFFAACNNDPDNLTGDTNDIHRFVGNWN